MFSDNLIHISLLSSKSGKGHLILPCSANIEHNSFALYGENTFTKG